MKKNYKGLNFFLTLCILVFFINDNYGQRGREFWFAAPDLTSDNGGGQTEDGGLPVIIVIKTFGQAASVRIDQPQRGASGIDTTIMVKSNFSNSFRIDDLTDVETTPANSIRSTGLRITSNVDISVDYVVFTAENRETFSLKAENALGTEFYIPLQNHFNNSSSFSPVATSSFDIVATAFNTQVRILSTVALDGHPASESFTITLNRGQSYSASFSGTDYYLSENHASGARVIADKPIAVTIKDDRLVNQGCDGLVGTQIVPTSQLGENFVAIKGDLDDNYDESIFVLATENNTELFLNNETIPEANLFAGETYRIDIDSLNNSSNNSILIQSSNPAYVSQISGVGCEMTQSLVPPLICAGSNEIIFTRIGASNLYLNIVVANGGQDNFDINLSGSATVTIDESDFVVVPGTQGLVVAARIQFSQTEVPSGTRIRVSNSEEVFSLSYSEGGAGGIIGDFVSEYSASINVNAGVDATVCGNDSIQLNGSVIGSALTGIWTTSGSGVFIPSETTIDAQYIPSVFDAAAGQVTLELTSTGVCRPVSDQMTLTVSGAPIVNAGDDEEYCANNAVMPLSGSVTVATGGVWIGGDGVFTPDRNTLTATYTPSNEELLSRTIQLTLESTNNGICNAESDNVVFEFTTKPTSNAGGAQTLCSNNPNLSLGGSVTVATGGSWTGGTGDFIPSTTALNANYEPSSEETSRGFVLLYLTTTGNQDCLAEVDSVLFTFSNSPRINAGDDSTLCANDATYQLDGFTSTNSGVWSGGFGSFLPGNTISNARYQPTPAEISNGNVVLTYTSQNNDNCNSENDNIQLNYSSAPTVNAGADQEVCANNATILLQGNVTNATGGEWSTLGSGSFDLTSSLSTTYFPSENDKLAGEITLVLTTTGVGNCLVVTDSLLITITPAPTVEAGSNQILCENNAEVSLAGNVLIATNGVWSGGNGVFSSSIDLNGSYVPTNQELTERSVVLYLTSSGNGLCNAVQDSIEVSFTAAPTANAGDDQEVCGNNSLTDFSGSVTVASGGLWSGGLGIYSPSTQNLNLRYSPSIEETQGDYVDLILTTTDNGNCLAVRDTVRLNFTPSPVLDGGSDRTVCENTPEINLVSTVTVATGVQWSNTGTGLLLNRNSLTPTYTISQGDLIRGSVTLIAVSVDNGNCNSVVDSIYFDLIQKPQINIIDDFSVCENNSEIQLGASIIRASGGEWTGGAGQFDPSSTDLSARYYPTEAELVNGFIDLTLNSTGNDVCLAESGVLTVQFTPSPNVEAGRDSTVCANNVTTELTGMISIASGGEWSGGVGVFSPGNAFVSNLFYTPTNDEIDQGFVDLILISTGNDNCFAETDTMRIDFSEAPEVNAGSDQFICSSNQTISLSGSVTIAGSSAWELGDGVFSEGSDQLITDYTLSASELNTTGIYLQLRSLDNGNCAPEIDSVFIEIEIEPSINAGPNLVSCANSSSRELGGNFSNSNGVAWTGGLGSFDPNSIISNPIYIPTTEEIASGSVMLYLNSTGTVVCNTITDSMLYKISQSPLVFAGRDSIFCSNNALIPLKGDVRLASGGVWTGGSGSYLPSNTALNAVYTPTADEISNGQITLELTSTGNGACVPISDQVSFSFSASPSVSAGSTVRSCSNNSLGQLSGTFTGSLGVEWSGGLGRFLPNAQDQNAQYIPSDSEITQGSVSLRLTTTGNGDCNAEYSDVNFLIKPSPSVSAGSDQTVCVDALDIQLGGSITGITDQGIWSTTNGTGLFLPNNSALNAVYRASTEDSIRGNTELTLISTDNGLCNEVSSSVNIEILPGGVADAGPNVTVCANNNEVVLNGQILGAATNGRWITSGSGVFTPNADALNATYTPSNTDIQSGTVRLTLTANACNETRDNLFITIDPSPMVNAGPDLVSCATDLEINLVGQVTGQSATGLWISTGTGQFLPSNTSLNARYIASSLDSLNQGVQLILRATNIGACRPEDDTLVYSIFLPGSADADEGTSVCSNNALVQLNGRITGGATQGEWSSSGSGTFIPNANALNATYVPSEDDAARGRADLTLTTLNACNVDEDRIRIDYTSAPVVIVGADLTVCGTNAIFPLQGSVSAEAGGGIWTSSGTGSFDNENAFDAIYTASNSDIESGRIVLTLTSIQNENCLPVQDSTIIIITDGVRVEAGDDEEVCAIAGRTILRGKVSQGTTTGRWETLGTGTFEPDDFALGAEYVYSAADLANRNVQLVLTSTNNGNCAEEKDTIKLDFGLSTFSEAGEDIILCETNLNATLSGFFGGGAQGGEWSSLGTGTFEPNSTDPNATYTASRSDSLNGGLELIFTTTGNGSCLADSDTLEVVIERLATVLIDENKTVCPEVVNVPVSAVFTRATGGKWTSSGTGDFVDPLSNQTSYVFSESDKVNGVVSLQFEVSSVAPCPVVSNSIIVSVAQALEVGFSAQNACEGDVTEFLDTSIILRGEIIDREWTFGDGAKSKSTNPINQYARSGIYDVNLKLTTSGGCVDSVKNQVQVFQSNLASFTVENANDLQVFEPVRFYSMSEDVTKYKWRFGDDISIEGSADTSYTFIASGTIKIDHIVENTNGCKDSTTQFIVINDSRVLKPQFPNGFSPNEDGQNDFFYPRGGPFKSIQFQVFNQWGESVFETNNLNEKWDGKQNGKDSPVGVYVYIFETVTVDDISYSLTGEITLIR